MAWENKPRNKQFWVRNKYEWKNGDAYRNENALFSMVAATSIFNGNLVCATRQWRIISHIISLRSI